MSLPCRRSSAFSACLGRPSSQTVASSRLPLHTLGRACASHSLERKQPEKRRLPRLGAPPSERQAFLLSLPAAPSCHMLSRAPIQSRPVPFQLAVGRESRGEAPAPVRPPFPSSLGGHRLWSSTRASLRWIKACGAEPVTQDEGPPKPGLCLLFIRWGPGASSPWKRLECREAQRAGSPPLRHQSKRLIWSPANGQRHPWRARRTSAGCQHSLTRAAEWSAQHDLCTHTQHIVVIMEGDFRLPPPCFAWRSRVQTSTGSRSRTLSAHLPGSALGPSLPIGARDSIPGSRRWQSRALPLGEASAGSQQFIRLCKPRMDLQNELVHTHLHFNLVDVHSTGERQDQVCVSKGHLDIECILCGPAPSNHSAILRV